MRGRHPVLANASEDSVRQGQETLRGARVSRRLSSSNGDCDGDSCDAAGGDQCLIQAGADQFLGTQVLRIKTEVPGSDGPGLKFRSPRTDLSWVELHSCDLGPRARSGAAFCDLARQLPAGLKKFTVKTVAAGLQPGTEVIRQVYTVRSRSQGQEHVNHLALPVNSGHCPVFQTDKRRAHLRSSQYFACGFGLRVSRRQAGESHQQGKQRRPNVMDGSSVRQTHCTSLL